MDCTCANGPTCGLRTCSRRRTAGEVCTRTSTLNAVSWEVSGSQQWYGRRTCISPNESPPSPTVDMRHHDSTVATARSRSGSIRHLWAPHWRISSVVPVKRPVTHRLFGMSERRRTSRSCARVGIRRLAAWLSGRGSNEDRCTSFAAARSDRGWVFGPPWIRAAPDVDGRASSSARRSAGSRRRTGDPSTVRAPALSAIGPVRAPVDGGRIAA